ncbi:ATP-binding protein [Burkholderia thailandensis]|nr:AAA family ATPase [Burkholderia thailandensis]MCS3395319.1 ATP-binding protein [Burkholderia thailandensis]MCS6428926.1 ATP-binding protein [Burkholderia thailandensis]MCS6456714.1 ATP-binding protein [Burkholderia thailandensis]MCS6468005.1 ATP-binding protein [Burkholderia thailandensis]MCS6486445.1 ATP-binding protein [Burkholderia thailandensis]
MRISSVSAKNFRSLKEVDLLAGTFNILVGQNNHGKTNLLEALAWFYTGKSEPGALRHVDAEENEEVIVELRFCDVQAGLAHISNEENRTKLSRILEGSDEMRVRRTSSDAKNRYVWHPSKGEWTRQPTGADSAFNNCIPRFEFVEATKSLKDVLAYKNTTPIGQMLSGIVTEVLEQDEAYRAFREKFEALFGSPDSGVRRMLNDLSERVQRHLEKQFPDCRRVDFQVDEPEFDELLKTYTTHLDDGVATTAEEKGDGMQRALMLAVINTHADFRRESALGRSFIFFLDEAELHLHPTAQRQLKSALLSLSSSGDQVFLTTHSSVFIADEHPDQKVFRVEKSDRNTSITPVERNDRQEVVYQLLGGNPADLLLPANFLLVEGPSEEVFFRSVIKRFYPDKPNIQVVAADGDDERQRQYLAAISTVYDPLGHSPIYKSKLSILCDSPNGDEKQRRFAAFKEANAHLERNGQLQVLPVNGLEDYYPADVRRQFENIRRKTRLAEKVAGAITQEQFETLMPVAYAALQRCWANAYVA